MGNKVTFATSYLPKSVEMQTGLSYVSIDNARENLEAEVGRFNNGTSSFDQVLTTTRDAWHKSLSTLLVAHQH